MKVLKYMHVHLPTGILLSSILVLSMFTLFVPVIAQEKTIVAKSIGFEETTIIEFSNNGDADIDTIRIWLGSDFNFKSFKTEKGWTGKKTPQGVIIFTTSDPVKLDQSVKFGIKTDKAKPGINWKALDKNEQQIDIGKTLVTESTDSIPSTSSGGTKDQGVFEKSTFRLIPEKPNVGSTIRVTGDSFGANQDLKFYIGNNKLESFETDSNGHFMITTQIPKNQKADRVNFVVKDDTGNEKTVSLRIGESEDRMAAIENIPLTMKGVKAVLHRGDFLDITGTATPGGTVTATIRDEVGNVISTIAVSVDLDGNWARKSIVPLDTPFGKQSAEITDGEETILRTWVVESDKNVIIIPESLRFEPGEPLLFNGTAIPGKDISIVIEDPQGTEVYSDIFEVSASGQVNIEFPTEFSSPEGTYILFATQDEETEITIVGLGESPQVQLVAKMDKLNYQSSDTATINVQGPASSIVSLLVVDPSDKNKFSDSITLGPEGSKNYELDLEGYASGVYTIVLKRGNAQTEEIFSVGLLTGSGPIEIRTTKDAYISGEGILILGESGVNILVTLTLIDPDGKQVKVTETITNKEGVFSDKSIRIPASAKEGTWKVIAKSGPNFDEKEISVIPQALEGIIVYIVNVEDSHLGKSVTIEGYGAAVSQNVEITIVDPEQKLVIELNARATKEGDFSTLWIIAKGTELGTYTIYVNDPTQTGETTFILE